jgi:hypothetical protein
LRHPTASGNVGARFLLPFEINGPKHPIPDMFAIKIFEHFDLIEHVLSCICVGWLVCRLIVE